MADLMNFTTASSGMQKAICTICFEDLKPITEDLQTLPICGHVFHELCIQQWLEYCPAGKKPTCPVCKQSCSRKNLTRLYFQSTGDSTELSSSLSTQGPANADAKTLAEEVRRLEMKLAAMTTASENQQAHLKKLEEELSAWKQLATREELQKEELKKVKEYKEHLLFMKMEELSIKTEEIAKLQERSMALAKELAALKLATDINLEEEEMVKLASFGHGSNTENALDVLKKSLVLRNKSYRDLMIQCNILGRSETRTSKKLEKANEKIDKLKIRLQEVEKALEEKENEILRHLKASTKLKPKQVNLSWIEQNVSCPTIEDQAVKQYAMENSNRNQICRSERTNPQKISSPPVYEENKCAVDWNMDSCNCIDVDNLNLISDSNDYPNLVVKREDGRGDPNAPPISGVGFYSMLNAPAYTMVGNDSKDGEDDSTEKILMSGIQKGVPCYAAKNEAQTCITSACSGNPSFPGSHVSEKAYRSMSRWRKHAQPISSSGDLIVVGADGRGGRIKVLKTRDECLGDSMLTVGAKRQKWETKSKCQFHIEHFFEKAQN
ncbi:E3 ubiquitin-protein ligase TRAIP-like [Phalaenopsis equestris]|uniref:E3 ubiquitin-protein ligase TRAIP-like n=1 Tax=Phalaenopsis equestris TaxID=78828 RepID=UPI0009E1DA28|nr:E3 ubiquitin-protein ligase TRAIP-like [Phalaenopsis equestris]